MITARRLGIIATPILVLSLMAFGWLQIIKPKLVKFAFEQLPRINAAQDAVFIEVENFDFSLMKLQLYADNIKLSVNKIPQLTSPFKISHVTAQIDIFDLIIGQLTMSKITLENLRGSYLHINAASDAEEDAFKVENILSILPRIPVDRLILTNPDIELKNLSTYAEVNLQALQVVFQNRKSEIGLIATDLKTDFAKPEKKIEISAVSDINLLINKNQLKILDYQLVVLNSSLNIKADLDKPNTIAKNPIGQVKFESSINLEDVRTLSVLFSDSKNRIPALTGNILSNGQLQLNGLSDVKGKIEINTSQIAADQFKLGQAKINAVIEKNKVRLTEIDIEHPAGKASLSDVIVEQKAPYKFETKLAIKNFDMQKFFVSIGENNIPAGLTGNGNADCSGSIEQLTLVCNAIADLRDVWVRPDIKDPFEIVRLDEGRINGQLNINTSGLTYKTKLSIGGSTGTSNGEVDFKKGFKLNFETDKLSFQDIRTLAQLKFKGDLKFSGFTEGDSDHGIINAKLIFSDAEIEDFKLGTFSTDLSYKESNLSLKEISGLVGKSEYNADINLNFDKSIVNGTIKSDKIYSNDLLSTFKDKFALNLDFFGVGNLTADFSGPFDFWQLAMNLKSHFKQGAIAGEKYENFTAEILSDGKKIDFKNVHLKKNKSSVIVGGEIDTTTKKPLAKLNIKGNPVFLEESDILLAMAPEISGVGYFDGKVTGPIENLNYETNFTLKQVSYDKVEYPNSQGQFSLDKDYFKLNGQFFGRQIQSDIVWPWQEGRGYSAKILINDMNPLFLLPLISLQQPGSDFASKLNAEIDLTAKNKTLADTEGYIKISDFYLQRGDSKLKLEKPSLAVFKKGFREMDPLNLKGENNTLNIKMLSAGSENVRLSVGADLQLRMFHFLVPFTQSLSGNLVLDSQILFKRDSIELFGEGELIDGYVAIKGFPQAIENINTPIEFSRSKILLSDIIGQIGQSDVTGYGQIDIIGSKNISVSLKAIADNMQLNFPEKIYTSGKANILFSGNWIPYTLKVDYKVANGLVEKDFDEADDQAQTLKASLFLPPKQYEQLSPSLVLDVNIDVSKGIILKNKLLEGEAKGILNITGTPEAPNIKGKIDITPGSTLIFKDTAFSIQTADINFQQKGEINPLIYISANSRVSDYDINLLVQGPAKNLKIIPTSQPPLSENDLISLLALGITSQTDQNISSDTQQKQTGLEVLAAISNKSQINKKIQQKFGLTVQLAPAIDSTKNIAVPKVVVSKKISNKLNASYAKPFTGNDQNQEIKLQYLYNSNVSILLNYQNKETSEEDQISGANSNSKSIWGLDLEYRDEFK